MVRQQGARQTADKPPGGTRTYARRAVSDRPADHGQGTRQAVTERPTGHGRTPGTLNAHA
ncbi:hypothetical protein SCAB_37681 [Streptomyces scabiei 87.22]|uniref:Uncharacterized protein n=1 Tax=Streptomyces scabiei (strain 87.22) TaxID=680198 RepID=C9YXS5_STRSW|nr:hypothetical protein SCAB_37681 [Streptomyces scabiei 87.22]